MGEDDRYNYTAQSDRTYVAKPFLSEKVEYRLKPGEYWFTDRYGKKVLSQPKNEQVSADNRTEYQRKEDRKKGELLRKEYEKAKEREGALKNGALIIKSVSPSTYIGPLFNNNGKSYWDNLMSGEGAGTGFEGEDKNLAIDLAFPLGAGIAKAFLPKAAGYLSELSLLNLAKYGTGEAKNWARSQVLSKSPFFIQTPNSYTRGLGIGDQGILDLVQTGIVRGNPRGTEVTAHQFAKLYRRNRNNFRDIMKDTGIKNIESKYFSRTLDESEFNAIKEAAKKYKSNSFEVEGNTIRLRSNSDPLSEYNTYDEYINSINKQIEEVNLMPQRVSSGEVEVNPVLVQGEDGYLRGIPIKERFGPNSDYIGDGTPLTYWYPDGRNAFQKGYDYAGSKWMVKVDNADKHQPFMHELHLHPSFFKAIQLSDPDVTVYRRLPFGIGLKVPKSALRSQVYK